MNHRQEKLLEELPKNNNIIKRAGIKAGYSESYANTQLPQVIRRCKEFKEYFNEATVKKELKLALNKCKKKEDYTNVLRAIELQSKILGLQIDKSEIKNVNPDKIVIAYGKSSEKVNASDDNKSPTENVEDVKK